MDSPLVERLGWTLVHFVWEGALVALALTAALPVARRASAELRYGLACAAMVLIATFPAATYLALAPPAGADYVSASLHSRATMGQTFTPDGAPSEGLLPLLVAVWAVGVAALSARLAGTLLHLERWKRRHARPAGPEWQTRVDALARRLGISRRIAVLVSDRIGVPSAWGALRAVVVLPTSLLMQLPPAQVETILLHELAHIRRHDYLVNLLQTVVETVLFYHPAVWWVSGVVRREREYCCDDLVVRSLEDPMPYARALLYLEERRLSLPHPTLSAKGSNLMNRIARILGAQPAPARLSPLASTLAALGVLGAVLGGALQAQAQAQTAPKSAHHRVAKPKPIRRAAKAAPAKVAPKAIALAKAPPAPTKINLVTTVAAPAPKAASSLISVQTLSRPVAAPAPAFVAARVAAPPAVTQGGGGFGGGMSGPPGIGMGGGFGGGMVGGGFGARGPVEDVSVDVDERTHEVSIDAREASLATVLRMVAKRSKISVVIGAGQYNDVTLVLSDMPVLASVQILCRAAGATYRMEEGGVFYVTPRNVDK